MISRALVVDDDETILMFLNTLLTKKFSMKVITAKDGFEGLEELEKGGVDLVFLDLMMPKLDGIGFLELMRSNHHYNHIPVIIVSAVNQKETIAKIAKLGIRDYILKPLEFLKITEKLNDLLLEFE